MDWTDSQRSESEYYCFGTGHGSTTTSVGLGMAVGRELKGERNNVVVVIGDGAMTIGQAYETMNNVRYLDSDMIVILNDNKQVSLPTTNLGGPIPHVGALSSAFSRLQLNRPLRELREVAKGVTKQIGGSMHELAAKVDEFARGMISGRQLSLVLVKDWVFPVVKVSSSLWPLQRNCNFLAPQSGHPISGDCVVFRRVFHLIMATLKQPLIHTY